MTLYRYDGMEPEVHETAFVHPDATLVGEVYLSSDCSVWPSATLRGDSNAISVGKRTNIQDSAVVHVSSGERAEIGKRVTVGHGAIVHGCTIEEEVLVGMGATVLSGAEIGEGSIVAAGTVVPEDEVVPPGSVVMGVPADLKRETTDDDREWIRENAREYVRKAQRYRDSLEEV
jgi:carbonic anhydrase/acetyltransferase-like protein (isoleucine patch superfamily)